MRGANSVRQLLDLIQNNRTLVREGFRRLNGQILSGDLVTTTTSTSSDTTGVAAGLTPDPLSLKLRALARIVGHDTSYATLDTEQTRMRLASLRHLEGAVAVATARSMKHLDLLGGVSDDGANSMSGWLSGNGGRSKHEAARIERLANTMDRIPATADALADGEISTDAADAVVAAVKRGRLGEDADVDAELAVAAKQMTPERLRGHVKATTQQRDGSSLLRDEKRQRALRTLTLNDDGDGLWDIRGKLPHEVALKTKTALDALSTADPVGTPVTEQRSYGQRQADAFEAMVDLTLDHGDLPATGGQTRPHIVVTVDASTICEDLTEDDCDDARDGPIDNQDPRWADLPGGISEWSARPLSPQAVRRICCDASLTRVLTIGPSQILDLGRTTPTWSGPQRTAIKTRDGGCRGPRCDRPTGWTQIHHVRWWKRDKGPTNIDNGLSLCTRCHHRVHDDGWQVHLDPNGAIAIWTSPTGTVIATRPHRPPDPGGRP